MVRTYIYIYIYIYMYICMYVCTSCMYICVYICMYIYLYVHSMYILICMYMFMDHRLRNSSLQFCMEDVYIYDILAMKYVLFSQYRIAGYFPQVQTFLNGGPLALVNLEIPTTELFYAIKGIMEQDPFSWFFCIRRTT